VHREISEISKRYGIKSHIFFYEASKAFGGLNKTSPQLLLLALSELLVTIIKPALKRGELEEKNEKSSNSSKNT
jgi:hypothetical protein